MASLDLVGLIVKDMAASLKFYRLLGLDIIHVGDDEQHVEFTTPGGMRLAWDTVELMKSIYPDWIDASTGQRMGLAFKCASAAEVDSLYQAVIDAGYHGHSAPWDAFWGQRYAVVVDPDGNHIDLFAAL